MKTQSTCALSLCIGIFFGGCNEQSETSLEGSASEMAQVQVEGLQSGPEWMAPGHPEFLVYSHKYIVGGQVGSTASHGVNAWSPLSRGSKSSSGAGNPGEELYIAQLEYKGSRDGRDCYMVDLSFPKEGGSSGFTRMFQYEGVDLEFWSNAEWRIGMRPTKKITPSK